MNQTYDAAGRIVTSSHVCKVLLLQVSLSQVFLGARRKLIVYSQTLVFQASVSHDSCVTPPIGVTLSVQSKFLWATRELRQAQGLATVRASAWHTVTGLLGCAGPSHHHRACAAQIRRRGGSLPAGRGWKERPTGSQSRLPPRKSQAFILTIRVQLRPVENC